MANEIFYTVEELITPLGDFSWGVMKNELGKAKELVANSVCFCGSVDSFTHR